MSAFDERFTNLEQATIINYLDEINLEEDLDLYDKMITHFVNGELDDDFYSTYLDDIEKVDKEKIFLLVHKYSGLCFKNGNYEYWTDSVFDFPLSDSNFICSRIFDNFDFLIKIARDGGENTLKFLKKLNDTDEMNESSVIDKLRGSFPNDTILEKIIIDMSQDRSLYNVLTADQLALLLSHPDGILYSYSDKEIKFNSISDVILEIYKRATGEEYNITDEDSIKKLAYIFRSDDAFLDAIIDMQSENLNVKIKK